LDEGEPEPLLDAGILDVVECFRTHLLKGVRRRAIENPTKQMVVPFFHSKAEGGDNIHTG
jgi:hypothetical protein